MTYLPQIFEIRASTKTLRSKARVVDPRLHGGFVSSAIKLNGLFGPNTPWNHLAKWRKIRRIISWLKQHAARNAEKRVLPVVTISGRTDLQCISCDDPALKLAESPAYGT
jgi:hypothetical protein